MSTLAVIILAWIAVGLVFAYCMAISPQAIVVLVLAWPLFLVLIVLSYPLNRYINWRYPPGRSDD